MEPKQLMKYLVLKEYDAITGTDWYDALMKKPEILRLYDLSKGKIKLNNDYLIVSFISKYPKLHKYIDMRLLPYYSWTELASKDINILKSCDVKRIFNSFNKQRNLVMKVPTAIAYLDENDRNYEALFSIAAKASMHVL